MASVPQSRKTKRNALFQSLKTLKELRSPHRRGVVFKRPKGPRRHIPYRKVRDIIPDVASGLRRGVPKGAPFLLPQFIAFWKKLETFNKADTYYFLV